MALMLDNVTRVQILKLYEGGLTQRAIASQLVLPVELVADVLDCKI